MPDIDNRPEIEPNHFSFCDLPDDGDLRPIIEREVKKMRGFGAQEVRATFFNDEFPSGIYPHGVYFEGWSVSPQDHAPPGKAAPFNYPMVAVS